MGSMSSPTHPLKNQVFLWLQYRRNGQLPAQQLLLQVLHAALGCRSFLAKNGQTVKTSPLFERNLPYGHRNPDRKQTEWLHEAQFFLIRHDFFPQQMATQFPMATHICHSTAYEPHLLQVLRETLGFQCLLEKRSRRAWCSPGFWLSWQKWEETQPALCWEGKKPCKNCSIWTLAMRVWSGRVLEDVSWVICIHISAPWPSLVPYLMFKKPSAGICTCQPL